MGTPSWWSPPQPLAASKVPRPVITAPVDLNSSTIWLLTLPCPPTAFFGWSPTPWKIHSCSRSPPSPRPLSGPSLGPVTNPSRDIDMDSTLKDIVLSLSRSSVQCLGFGRRRRKNGFLPGTATRQDGPKVTALLCTAAGPSLDPRKPGSACPLLDP